MASRYKTGRIEEALMASEEIVGLSREILSKEQFARAIRLSTMLISSKAQKEEAICELQELIAPPPKRPLYYAQHELEFLPHWTRDAIRDLGDYIDILTKHLAYGLTKYKNVRTSSLGVNIRIIESEKKEELNQLLDWLKRYNSFVYRPGKHDFHLSSNRREHRFTSKEVVLTAFMTIDLANRIREITNCSPELNCHCGD